MLRNAGYDVFPPSGSGRDGSGAPLEPDISSPVSGAVSPRGPELEVGSLGTQCANDVHASTNTNACESEGNSTASSLLAQPTSMEVNGTAFRSAPRLTADAGEPGASSGTGRSDSGEISGAEVDHESDMREDRDERDAEYQGENSDGDASTMDGFVISDDHSSMTEMRSTDRSLSPSLIPPGASHVEWVNVFSHTYHTSRDNEERELSLGGRVLSHSEVDSLRSESLGPSVQATPTVSPAVAQLPPANALSSPKRPAAADPNTQGPRKRQGVASEGHALIRRGADSASGPETGPVSGVTYISDGPILKCDIINYTAVQEKAFRGKHPKKQDMGKARDMFGFYTNITTMVRALDLLGRICSDNETMFHLDSVTVGHANVATVQPRPDALTLAKGAGIWANSVIKKCEDLTRRIALRQVMALITLHLIHKNVILPMWEQRSPERVADGRMKDVWQFYFETLGGKEELCTTLRTFKDRIRYGRAFFTLTQSIGAPALLMIPASGRGVVAIARELTNSSHVIADLTTALSTSHLWWCFSHAIGHLTVARLYSGAWPRVTSNQLAYWMRTQPLPVDTLHEWETICGLEGLAPQSHILPDSLRLVPHENYPTVSLHWLNHTLRIAPMIASVDVGPANEVQDLGEWLLGLDEGEAVTISTGQSLGLHVLQDLLPGRVITSGLMDFFCALHNSRSLDGFMALDSGLWRVLLHGPEPHTGLDKLREAMGDVAWERGCREILGAIESQGGILGFQVSVGEKCALLYNWLGGLPGAELQSQGLEVGYTPH